MDDQWSSDLIDAHLREQGLDPTLVRVALDAAIDKRQEAETMTREQESWFTTGFMDCLVIYGGSGMDLMKLGLIDHKE